MTNTPAEPAAAPQVPSEAEGPKVCARCLLVHERCKGHNSAGLPCGRHAMHDQEVCMIHGGKSPQALRAAAERRERREAMEASQTFGLPRVIDPHSALLEELHRSAGVVSWYSEMVATLDADDVAWGITREKVGGDDWGTTREASRNMWVGLWQEERRHFLAVAVACTKAGIEERRIMLAEDRGRLLGGAVQRILAGLYEALAAALGEYEAARLVVDAMWGDAVATIVPAELRAVAAMSVEGGPDASAS